MSLEHEFSRIATALESIAAALAKGATTVTPAAEVPQAPKSKPVQVPVATVTVTPAPAPVEVPQVVTAAPVTPVVAASPAAASPFSDGKAVIQYTMAAYQALGPIKGSQIQGILSGLGCVNINDLKAEQYAAFHAAVEALKVAA